MTKKNFIALADTIRSMRGTVAEFHTAQIAILAAFCASQSASFDRAKWEKYITK